MNKKIKSERKYVHDELKGFKHVHDVEILSLSKIRCNTY